MSKFGNRLTEARLKQIERRLERATAGGWYSDEAIAGDGYVVMSKATGFRVAHLHLSDHTPNAKADAEFIAHAREDVEELLKAVRRSLKGAGDVASG